MTQLERELRGSLAMVEMQKALREAIPLLRQQQQSLSQAVALFKSAGQESCVTEAMQDQHDEWLQALMHCEAALKGASVPVVICEEVWR